jgi:hypothetical protein
VLWALVMEKASCEYTTWLSGKIPHHASHVGNRKMLILAFSCFLMSKTRHHVVFLNAILSAYKVDVDAGGCIPRFCPKNRVSETGKILTVLSVGMRQGLRLRQQSFQLGQRSASQPMQGFQLCQVGPLRLGSESKRR